MRDEDRHWDRYGKALDILERRRPGLAVPILRSLAIRGFVPAQCLLSDFETVSRSRHWLREAARSRDPIGLYNLAMEELNRGSLRKYRLYLSYAAKIDLGYRDELKRFKTRFNHSAAKNLGRYSPKE